MACAFLTAGRIKAKSGSLAVSMPWEEGRWSENAVVLFPVQ